MYTVPFCGMKFKKAKDKNNDSQSNKTFTMYLVDLDSGNIR